MDERGWSYADLERRTEHRLTKSRLQQLGSGIRMREFPEPSSIALLADALEVEVTTVVLAAAQSVGLDARRRGPDLAHLLPSGTDRLSPEMQAAILTMIRAAVAETLAVRDEDDEMVSVVADGVAPRSYAWPKGDALGGRNAAVTRAENTP